MADGPRLTSADYVVIHAVGFICTRFGHDPDWETLVFGMLRDALPRISRGPVVVEEFARVAADLMASGGGAGGSAAWLRARYEGEKAVERFHQARMAEAWDVFRKGAANG